MKSTVLRGFFAEVLKARGAKTAVRGTSLLEVRTPPALLDRLGAEDLLLAFNARGLQEAPEAELATAGNPVFDRVLELALDGGSAGQRYAAPPVATAKSGRGGGRSATDSRTKAPDPGDIADLQGLEFGPPAPVYAPFVFLVFRVRYSLEEVPDDLEVIPIDAVSETPLAQHPDLPEYWESLDVDPADDRPIVRVFPVEDRILQLGLDTLEHRLRKRLHRVRRAAQEHLDRETENVRSYYQQLIEETRRDGRRAGTPEAREQKIHLLQLDWRRRTEEARSFWNPRVDVSLAVTAAVQRPCLSFPVTGPLADSPGGSTGRTPRRRPGGRKERPGNEGAVYYDLESREWRVPPSLLGLKLPS